MDLKSERGFLWKVLIFAVLLATLILASVESASATTLYPNLEGSIQDAEDAWTLADMFIVRETMMQFHNETPKLGILTSFDHYPWPKGENVLNPPFDDTNVEDVYNKFIHNSAYSPEEDWNRTFGGAGEDDFRSVQVTADGGYIIAGYTDSYGAGYTDAWLIKTDSNGNEQWNRTFGGWAYDYGYSVQQTTDGGYIIGGETCSYSVGYWDAWLIKTDSSGNELWNRTFGDTSYDDVATVQQTTDGGYIIIGTTRLYDNGYSTYAWLVKTDYNGNEQWNRTYGGAGQRAYWGQQTTDGGYIFTMSYPNLVKTDSNGNEQWNKTYGDLFRYSYLVQQTTDDGYVLAGLSWGQGFRLLKTNFNGTEQWNKTYRIGTIPGSIQQTADEGYIVLGASYTTSYKTDDIWLIKINYKGTIEWEKSFGDTETDLLLSVKQATKNDFILAGYTGYVFGDPSSKDAWLIKLNVDPEEFTIHNTNTSEDFPTIQVAIEDHDTVDGHTIMVDPGIYNENVVVYKSLTLKGIGMPVVNATTEIWDEKGITVLADYCIIEGINITESSYGIEIASDNNRVINNIVFSNNVGIKLSSSHNNTISGNTVTNNDYGINLIKSSYNTLTNNTADLNLVGLEIEGSEKSHFDNVVDITNTVNGKPIYYYFDEQGQVIEGLSATHVTLAYCSDFTIKNCILSNGDGIFLAYSSNNTIRNSEFSKNRGCVIIGSNNTITENNVSNNKEGIYIAGNNNTITHNIVSNNSADGISVGPYSQNTLIMDNLFSNNGNEGGLVLNLANNNTIRNNTANNNSVGFLLWSSKNNTITNNNISSNSYGLAIISSINNNFMRNTVCNNDYGIFFDNSYDNEIHNNYFDNTNNAYDEGDNIWNVAKTPGTNVLGGSWLGGNYWSDYTGKDTNGDGLGDTLLPYNSSGNILSGGDWLPLVKITFIQVPIGVTSNISLADTEDITAYLPPEYDGVGISDAVVLNVNVTDDTPANASDAAYTDITISVGEMDIETCKVFKSDLGFLPEVPDVTTQPTVKPPGEPAFSRDLINSTVTIRLYVGDPLLAVLPSAGPLTFSLDLVTGLNLISMPINDASITTAASLAAKLGPNCSEVIAFNATQQQLQSYVPGVPLNNFAIVGAEGYFVNLNNPTPVILTGTGWPSPFSVSLVPGLNLVGMPVNDTAVTTASTLATKIGASCQEVVNWESGTQSYVSYVTGVPLNDFAIRAGNGYFVTVDDQTEVTFEGDPWEN